MKRGINTMSSLRKSRCSVELVEAEATPALLPAAYPMLVQIARYRTDVFVSAILTSNLLTRLAVPLSQPLSAMTTS